MVTDWKHFLPLNALALLEATPPSPVSGKVEREIAALFLDIEGCTRLCEDLPPAEMNDVFEAYFSEFLDGIRFSGGEVTEVLGDGLLALFEGGDLRENVASAVQAAIEVQARAHDLNQRRRGRHDPITVNLGLNAGRALVGFTRLRARSGARWFYDAAGPVTNLAARLCAHASHGQILTTKAATDLLPEGCRCRSIGRQAFKNVGSPVEVVEILPTAGLSTGRRHPEGAASEPPRPGR